MLVRKVLTYRLSIGDLTFQDSLLSMEYQFPTIGSIFPSFVTERSADELGVTEATLSLLKGFTSNPNITCSLVPSQWPTSYSVIQYPKLFIPGESPTWNVDWTPQDINSVSTSSI